VCWSFLRFHSARDVGKKGLYPFAVLFRELSTEQKANLVERAHTWPDALRTQPEWYRNDLQADPLDSKVGGHHKWSTIWLQKARFSLRFNCKNLARKWSSLQLYCNDTRNGTPPTLGVMTARRKVVRARRSLPYVMQPRLKASHPARQGRSEPRR
jgi:hypothetical protein